MSKYYNIKGLKIRISDHEPNFSMDKFRGVNDIELYVRSADNKLLSIVGQLEYICDKRNLDINDFAQIINEWEDGTYSKDIFAFRDDDDDDENNFASLKSLQNLKEQKTKSNDEKLNGYTLSKFAKHSEIKQLSEVTGVSQSYIKKYFNIR